MWSIMNPWIRTLFLGFMTLMLVSFADAGHPLPLEPIYHEEILVRGPGLVAAQIVDIGHTGGGPPVLISIVISEVGLALGQADELIPVRLQVERVRGLDPSRVRMLLGENRTLGEIKAEIEGAEEGYIHRGNLRFGHAHYLLENLSLSSEELNTTLEADLMEPVWGWCAIPDAPESGLELAGRIFVQTSLANGSEIGAGSLVIFSGPYAGSYALVLASSVGPGLGIAACPDWMDGLAGSELFGACWIGDWSGSLGLGSLGFGSLGSGCPGPCRKVTVAETIRFSPESAGMPPFFCPGCWMSGCPFEPEFDDVILRDLGCGGLRPDLGVHGWYGGDVFDMMVDEPNLLSPLSERFWI